MKIVRAKGVEPSRPQGRNLNPAHLPIPLRARPAVALGQRRHHSSLLQPVGKRRIPLCQAVS